MPDWLDDRVGLARSQTRSSEVGHTWTRAADARIGKAFAGVAAGDLDATAAAAERLLGDRGWVGEMLMPLTQALRDDPAFTPPFRAHRDALRTGAVLYDGSHATISASVLSADAMATLPPPTSVVAGGRVSIVRYHRAGGATLRVWDAPVAAGIFPPPRYRAACRQSRSRWRTGWCCGSTDGFARISSRGRGRTW